MSFTKLMPGLRPGAVLLAASSEPQTSAPGASNAAEDTTTECSAADMALCNTTVQPSNDGQ